MISIEFKEQIKVLLKSKNMTDEECSSLPIYTDGEVCISCWEMSWKERFLSFILGKIWLRVHSGITQPPVSLEVRKIVFANEKNDI